MKKYKGLTAKIAESKGVYDPSKLTLKALEDWATTEFTPRSQKVIMFGDTAEMMLNLPDEEFAGFCRNKNIELWLNVDQLKRFNERVGSN